VLIYYLIRVLDRYIIPYLFGKPGKKENEKFRQTETRQKKRFDKDDGEYVDYEEVE